MTAASTPCCSLCVTDDSSSVARREREVCTRSTSRSPIRREANCEVPPCSLPEHLQDQLLPQFSTIVCASPLPYVEDTWAID